MAPPERSASLPLDEEAVNDLYKGYIRYDLCLDIVSCWEAFFAWCAEQHPSICFHRFPVCPVPVGKPLTPDFCCAYGDKYGLVFDVKTGIPNDQDMRKRQIENNILPQLKKYSEISTFNCVKYAPGNGLTNFWVVKPKLVDVVIVGNYLQSEILADSLFGALDDPRNKDFVPARPPILLIENRPGDLTSKAYTFRKHHDPRNGNFADTGLNSELDLGRKLTTGDKTLTVLPKAFMDLKIQTPLVNDDPPPLYLASLLWTRYLPAFLDEVKGIRAEDGFFRGVKFVVTIQEMADFVNQKIPTGRVQPEWIEHAFLFCGPMGLARKTREHEFEIILKQLRVQHFRRKLGIDGKGWDVSKLLAALHVHGTAQARAKQRSKAPPPHRVDQSGQFSLEFESTS